jgi:hypothetical protein
MNKLTIYGLPLNPMPALEQLRGASFCVSYGTRGKLGKQLDQAIELVGDVGSNVLLIDNGAFSAHQAGVNTMTDESYLEGFADWANDILDRCPQAIAILPDVIGGSEEENKQLVLETMGMFPDDRVMPVWHMHESFDYLLWLCEAFGYVGIGSSVQYFKIGTKLWHGRMVDALAAIEKWEAEGEGAYIRPRLHMLRAQAMAHLYPLDSSDSVNVAMNHKRAARSGSTIAQTAARIDGRIQASAGPAAEHQVKQPLDFHVQAYNEDLANATRPGATEADVWLFNYRHGELPGAQDRKLVELLTAANYAVTLPNADGLDIPDFLRRAA